jgi:hypothetical protein
MRPSVSLLALVSIGMPPLVVAACSDDPTPSAPSTPDAGTTPVPADGSAADAGADADADAGADADAAADGPVTVTVSGADGPVADALVVFHDASGAVSEVKRTGTDGKIASGDAIPQMVSVLVAKGLEHAIFTWVGVQNGDHLVVREPNANAPVGSYDVSFSSTVPVDAGVTPSFKAETGRCTSTGGASPIRVPLFTDCLQASNSVLVSARKDGTPFAFSFLKGVAPPAKLQTAAVTAGSWSVPSTVNVTLRNAPDGRARAMRLSQLSEGAAFESGFSPIGESVSFGFATGFAEALQANLFVDGPTTGVWRGLAKRVTPGSPIELDFVNALPELANPAVSGTDVRRPIFSWAGAPADASGGIVRVVFTGPRPEEGYTWSFIVPPGQNTLTAPAMPAEAESFLPKSTSPMSVFVKPDVAFMKSDLLPSYATFRRLPGVTGNFPGSYFLPPLATNGTLLLTATSRVGGL